MFEKYVNLPYRDFGANLAGVLASAVKGGSGWALVYMPLFAGLILWTMSGTAMPQKAIATSQNGVTGFLREIDTRLEGLEVAIMGLQVQSHKASGKLKQVSSDVGNTSVAVTRLYWLAEQIKKETAKPGKTQKVKPLNTKATGKPKSLKAKPLKVSTSKPKKAKGKTRVKQAQVAVRTRSNVNYSSDNNPTDLP